MLRPEDFIQAVNQPLHTAPWTKMGTIDSGYVSGRPRVKWDGETTASTRTYPYLASYTPAASHRVIAVKAGHSWVVIGNIV